MTGRLNVALIGLLVLFFLILSRLFYWQVVKAAELSYMGKSQYGTYLKIPSARGEILTSDGFPIAANKIAYLVFANPKEVTNKEEFINKLNPLLSLDPASVSAQLSLDRFWVPIQDGIDNDTKEKIESLKIPGVGFEEESQRFYPEASLAAQLVGFVGKDQLGEDRGYFGLEGEYNLQLRGKDGIAVSIHDAFGKPILSHAEDTTKAIDGRTLLTSIDRSIQFMVDKKLKDGVEKYGAASGMVGIIDPKTGNIIAMSSYPNFDPSQFQKYSADLYKNPFISNLYEPGSTFKSLIMAAALDAGVVKPDTKCPICEGPVSIGGYDIRTWDNNYFKDTNMVDVIQHSDNTGMVYVAEKLGLDRVLSYFNSFGIGKATGIDLQGEVSSYVKPRENWYPIDLATAGFGQGISVTPIELLDAFAAIANGGKRMEPHIVTQIQTPEGDTVAVMPKVLDSPISEKTSKVMTEILVNAVEKGEAKWTKLPGYRVAGKTGTAQIPIAGHYDPNKTIASFIGFAPADNPKFAMVVIIDRPTTSIYGAETAAPIFFDIAKDILSYYKIPPSQ